MVQAGTSVVIPLHDHQEDFYQGVRLALRGHQSVLAQGACGIGKTFIGSKMVKTASERDNHVIFTVHRRELLEQTSNTFSRFDIAHSYLAAGRHHNPRLNVHIATVGTLFNRLEKLRPPRLLIQDECHYSPSRTWDAILQWAKEGGAKIVGLSATPIRFDGKGFESQFDTMVKGPPVSWLIENGYLSDYRAYAPHTPDLSDVSIRAGEFAADDLEKVMSGKALVGNCVEHYRRYALGKKTIVYAVTVNHSEMLAAEFNAAGIPAAHLDANTPEHIRRQHILNFATGHLWVLTNCSLFAEGLDLAALAGRDVSIEAGIFARPTKSLALHVQQVMRPMRRKPYPAILIDMAGNFSRHGLPDHPHEWTLQGRPKKGRGGKGEEPAPLVRKCVACDLMYAISLPACPHCGEAVQSTPSAGRKVEEVAGQLHEVDREQVRRRLMKEQGEARSIDALIELGRKRGYKSPDKWAANVWTARLQRDAGM